MPAPRYEGTARDWYYGENERLKDEYWRLIAENERLRREIERFFARKRGLRSEKEDLPPGNTIEQES
jgi:hypothetical protein